METHSLPRACPAYVFIPTLSAVWRCMVHNENRARGRRLCLGFRGLVAPELSGNNDPIGTALLAVRVVALLLFAGDPMNIDTGPSVAPILGQSTPYELDPAGYVSTLAFCVLFGPLGWWRLGVATLALDRLGLFDWLFGLRFGFGLLLLILPVLNPREPPFVNRYILVLVGQFMGHDGTPGNELVHLGTNFYGDQIEEGNESAQL